MFKDALAVLQAVQRRAEQGEDVNSAIDAEICRHAQQYRESLRDAITTLIQKCASRPTRTARLASCGR